MSGAVPPLAPNAWMVCKGTALPFFYHALLSLQNYGKVVIAFVK